MGKEAVSAPAVGSHAAGTDSPPATRRSLMRRGGLAVLGAAAAAPLVGAGRASAAGTQLAYLDEPGTFASDMRFDGRVGMGTAPSGSKQLVIRETSSDWALDVGGAKHAATFAQTQDLAGEAQDTVNVFHTGTGDGLYIDHKGGRPPGYTGPSGGNAGLNVMIPYNLDSGGTGREGNTRNDRTGMKAIFVQTMPTTDDVVSLEVNHWSNSYAALFTIQPPGHPQGTGGGIIIDDYSQKSSLRIGKRARPGAGEAMLVLAGLGSSAMDALSVDDENGTRRALIQTDGTTSLGTGNPFGVRLHVESSGSGTARSLALVNRSGAAGSGTQIEFDDQSHQQALIHAAYETTSSPRNASLRFSVRSNDNMAERLRLSGQGIGFFGATPVARPVVSGGRSRNDALASLLNALANLGLITNSTTNN